jgi:hypothetical protein
LGFVEGDGCQIVAEVIAVGHECVGFRDDGASVIRGLIDGKLECGKWVSKGSIERKIGYSPEA